MSPTPVGAVIEIIERNTATDSLTSGTSVIAPNEIRLNGVSILSPQEAPVKIHDLTVEADRLVSVTLTLMARRVLIGGENDIAAQPPLYGEGHFFAHANADDEVRPVKIERRMAADMPGGGVIVDTFGLSVERAEQFVERLQDAIAQVKASAHQDEAAADV